MKTYTYTGVYFSTFLEAIDPLLTGEQLVGIADWKKDNMARHHYTVMDATELICNGAEIDIKACEEILNTIGWKRGWMVFV